MEEHDDHRTSFLHMLANLGVQDSAVYLLRKFLLKSDIDRSQSRLQLKRSDVENSDLPRKVPSLRENMARAGEDHQQRPPAYTAKARMVNSLGQVFAVDFKYMNSSNSYRIMDGWNQLARSCGMAEGQLVELWWFDVSLLANAGADEGGQLPKLGLAILNHPVMEEYPRGVDETTFERLEEPMPQHDQIDDERINIVEQAEELEEQHEVDVDVESLTRDLDEETRQLVKSLWLYRNCRPTKEDINLGKRMKGKKESK